MPGQPRHEYLQIPLIPHRNVPLLLHFLIEGTIFVLDFWQLMHNTDIKPSIPVMFVQLADKVIHLVSQLGRHIEDRALTTFEFCHRAHVLGDFLGEIFEEIPYVLVGIELHLCCYLIGYVPGQ